MTDSVLFQNRVIQDLIKQPDKDKVLDQKFFRDKLDDNNNNREEFKSLRQVIDQHQSPHSIKTYQVHRNIDPNHRNQVSPETSTVNVRIDVTKFIYDNEECKLVLLYDVTE